MTSATNSNGASKPVEGPAEYTSPALLEIHVLNLAKEIFHQSANIVAYLQQANTHSTPRLTTAFGPDAIDPPETAEYNSLRSSLKASLDDLRRLVDGPRGTMRQVICSGNDLAAFQVAFDFKYFTIVPIEGDEGITMEELAAKAGMDVDRTAHVVRSLATHRVFRETRPGHVVHTAASAIFARDDDLLCAGHYMCVAPGGDNDHARKHAGRFANTSGPLQTRRDVEGRREHRRCHSRGASRVRRRALCLQHWPRDAAVHVLCTESQVRRAFCQGHGRCYPR